MVTKSKWQYKMWYYTKKDAKKVADSLKKRGFKTRITRAKNLNQPEGGRYIHNVWYK